MGVGIISEEKMLHTGNEDLDKKTKYESKLEDLLAIRAEYSNIILTS